MRLMLLATTAFAIACTTPVFAQRSLFDQPVANPQPAPTPAAPAPAAPAASAPPAAPAAPASVAPTREAAPAAATDDTPAASTRRKARRAKPRGPVPARSLAVSNATPTALVALLVSQDGRGAELKRPLGPGKKTRLSLPAFKSCEVSVSATFEGQAAGEGTPVDICKEKSLNFKD